MTKEFYDCPATSICPTAILEWNLKTGKIYFSSHWLKMVGFEYNDRSDYTFDNLINSVHPEDKSLVIEHFDKIKEDGKRTNFSYRIKTNDEIYKWMNLIVTATKFANERPSHLVAVQQDINDFMDAQNFLNEINIKFRKLIENFSGGILMEDENRKVFYINNDLIKLFNMPFSSYQLIGSDCSNSAEQVKDLFTEPERFLASIDNALKNKVSVHGEIFKMKSGAIIERDYVPVSEGFVEKGHLWLYRDITKLKKNEDELEFRLGFEEIIINLSSKFINLDWTNIDSEIDEALGIIGSFISADRSYIFLFNEDKSLMNNTHEWVNEGISREKENLQNIPTDIFPWWMKKLKNYETIYIPSVPDLSEEAFAEKEILEPQNIKSLVAVPLIYKNDVIGYFGFDAVQDFKTWTEDSIKILNIAGGVITNALKRKENEETLSKTEARYKLISHLITDYAIAYSVDKEHNVKVDWTTESINKFFEIEPDKTYNFREFDSFIHPDDLDYVYKQRKKLQFSAYVTSEFRIITKNGRVRWIKEYGLSEISTRGEDKKYHLAAQDITESKLHEEKLLGERTLLRTIIDNIPDPIYVKDLEGRKILVNNAELLVLGAQKMEDVIGKKDNNFYPPDVCAKTQIEDEQVMKNNSPLINKEGFVSTKTGETKWFIGNKIPFRDSSGKVKGLVGVSYNITERKLAEDALKRSEAKYKYVVNNIKEVIFQTDSQGLWSFLNPAWTEITGFTIEESLGRNFLDYVHPDDRERNTKLFIPLINREKEYCRHEIRYLTKEGGFRWIEVFARLTIDEAGIVTGTSGTLNDVTIRKQSEEEIRKLSRAVETSPAGILLATLDGTITYVNPGLVKMGQYTSQADFAGKNIYEFTNDTGQKILSTEIMPALTRGEMWSGETKVKKASGEFFPIEIICAIIHDEYNQPQYILATFYDITHRKEAELEIKNALAKEKELNELKSKFVSMVSHEFRTPLAAILSSSDLLELYWDKWTVEKRNSLLAKIKRSIKNLIEILNDVTEINRADSGKVAFNYEEIDLVHYIEELIEELKVGNEDAPLIHFAKYDSSIFLKTDKKLLRQVFVNLISNAIKYTPKEKNVYISVKQTSGQIFFSVKDEGIGIPEEDFNILFEPFMRSKNTGKIKGTGLGLSILKRALDLLDAKIDFESKVDVGSTFNVYIPTKTQQ